MPLGRILAAVCCLLLPVLGRGDERPADDPSPFFVPEGFKPSGEAIGSRFKVSLRADPTELWEGDAIALTVIVASPDCSRPPKRPRLKELWKDVKRTLVDKKTGKEVERLLFNPAEPFLAIDPRTGKDADKADRTPEPGIWEFDYRIRPLREELEELPSLRFHYWRPSATPGLPGQYQATHSNKVALKVKPKVEPPPIEPKPIRVPAHILAIADGPAVLRRPGSGHALPSLPVLIVCLLAPPLAGLGWYVGWRVLFPDAARRARLRQSLAAKQALRALEKLTPGDANQRAWRVARIAAGYLQARLGLPGAEPTPGEVAAWLQRAGTSGDLAGRAAAFFRACDAARFAPAPPVGPDELTAVATQLIQTLEAESWAAQVS